MNLPKKDFESYGVFAESFALDVEQTEAEVKGHLDKLHAKLVGEIYDRFAWPKKAKTKKDKVASLVSLWLNWKDSAPESVIEASLVPMEKELAVSLISAKTLAEQKLAQIKEMDFENITSEEVFTKLSGSLSDLKDLANKPDELRKDAIKPISSMLSRIQKSIKSWRSNIELTIDLQKSRLDSWAKNHIESQEAKAERAQDTVDYFGAIKEDIFQLVMAAESAKNNTSKALVEGALYGFETRFRAYHEQLKSVIGEQGKEIVEGHEKLIELGVGVYKDQALILEAKTMAEAGEANKARSQKIEEMQRESERISTVLGVAIDEYSAKVKEYKPKSQLGLRRKLVTYITSLGSMNVEGMNLYDISADIMEDPEVIAAINKCIGKKVKAEGIKTGDSVESYVKGLGDSISCQWEFA